MCSLPMSQSPLSASNQASTNLSHDFHLGGEDESSQNTLSKTSGKKQGRGLHLNPRKLAIVDDTFVVNETEFEEDT